MRRLRSLLHPLLGIALAVAGALTYGRPALACLWWSTVGPADRAEREAFRAICADAPQLMTHGIALGGCAMGAVWCLVLWAQHARRRALTSADVPPPETSTERSPALGSDVQRV